METSTCSVADCATAVQLHHHQQLQHLPAPVSVQWGASDCPSSDEPDGGSPVSERSATMQLCGPHPHRVQPPKKGMMRWLLRQLQRKQQHQHQHTREGKNQLLLVSGDSFNTLTELTDEACCTQPTVTNGDQHTSMLQHPALVSHPAPAAADQQLPEVASNTPRLTAAQAPTHSSNTRGPDGLVRRCVKAVLRPVVHALCSAARALASSAGPQGPGNNDNSMAERIVNVLTSLPFFAVGLHGLRNRRCPKGRQFALSFLALGAVASGYHGADRSSWLRPVMRKLDYYTICYTSTVLRRAAHISLPRGVALASALIAPVKPTAVTGLNLLLVEGKFMRSALAHSHLRSAFQAHVGSAAVGMVCFAYEDVATGMGWPPVLHSLWHCLSALAMGCVHCLLHHLELAVLVEGVQLEAAGSS